MALIIDDVDRLAVGEIDTMLDHILAATPELDGLGRFPGENEVIKNPDNDANKQNREKYDEAFIHVSRVS